MTMKRAGPAQNNKIIKHVWLWKCEKYSLRKPNTVILDYTSELFDKDTLICQSTKKKKQRKTQDTLSHELDKQNLVKSSTSVWVLSKEILLAHR